MQQRNVEGGRILGTANTQPMVLDTIVDQPSDGLTTPYTILTPVAGFEGVVLKRRFRNGRVVVYDPHVARQFVHDFGYRCEPELPEEPKRKAKRRGHKTYVRP